MELTGKYWQKCKRRKKESQFLKAVPKKRKVFIIKRLLGDGANDLPMLNLWA
jgi:hypothetical protein